MSLPTSTASPPRLLKPVAGKIMNDGAAHVLLSPHKGVRNAAIIYEAIRNLPDKTLVRGDFDKKSQPLIYFPERPPKKIGQRDPVAEKNIRHDRAEFASFMRSIVDAAYKSAPVNSPQLQAAIALRSKTLEIGNAGRDFTVGDIKGPLRSIAKAHNRKVLKDMTSPHRLQTAHSSPLQARRFRQFADIKGAMTQQLCEALSKGVGGKEAHSTALMAVQEMKQMLFSYRVLRDAENLSFAEFLQKHPIPRGAKTFARLWLALSGPDRAGRVQFCTEAWALEMDKICPLILKQYNTTKRLKHRGGRSEEWSGSEASSASSETESSASPMAERLPRVLKRRRVRAHPGVVADAYASEDALRSPTLNRQASMPQLRRRSRQEGASEEKSSDPQVSFIEAEAQVRTVIHYSEIDASGIASGAALTRAFAGTVPQTRLVPDLSASEELSRTANDSGNADIFSQEEH